MTTEHLYETRMNGSLVSSMTIHRHKRGADILTRGGLYALSRQEAAERLIHFRRWVKQAQGNTITREL